MSKEFEDIVLKKLEVLDERTQNLEVQIKDNSKKLGNLEIEVKDTKHELKDLKTKVEANSKKIGNLETEVKANSQKLGNLEIELKDTQEIVKKLNQDFTKFDYEINKKIDTLFDAYTTNREKDMVLEDNITSLKAKTFDHDIRISNLENKVLTA